VPTALASSNGHLWDARDGAPLDLRQYAAVFGLLPWMQALQAAQQEVTCSQMRSLLGQGVHAAAAALVLNRTMRRLGTDQWRCLRTFGSLGSGVDTFGAVLLGMMTKGASYVWAAEGCLIARRAHRAFWTTLGQCPQMFPRADDLILASTRWSVDVELLTLRCAPFSPMNRTYPAGCDAALAELSAVLRGVCARRPRLIVYENTQGLWRRAEMRARVEMILSACSEYEWEAMLVSPHMHAGVPVRRVRVFYVAMRR